MKLSFDFRALEEAVRAMGAEPIDFEPGVLVEPLDPIDAALEVGLEIEIDAVVSDGGLLSYEGRQVLLYIQDQGRKITETLEDGGKGRKFHVATCQTLVEMKEKGRFQRYVATNRLDGVFFVSGVDFETGAVVEGEARLRVCRNCLKRLNYRDYRNSPQRQKNLMVTNFSIGEFFETYASFFRFLPRRRAGPGSSEHYTPDWPRIAGELKARADFTCSDPSCRVNLQEHKNLLHVHHRDGVKNNNRPENLEVLCAACHRSRPMHSHLFVSHEQMKVLNSLRQTQGLMGGGDWRAVGRVCDPGLHGLVEELMSAGIPLPVVGLELEGAAENELCALELAWPRARTGIAISAVDRERAEALGWRVFHPFTVLDDVDQFAALLRAPSASWRPGPVISERPWSSKARMRV